MSVRVRGLLPNFLKHLEAGGAGKLEVENNETGHGKFFAIRKLPRTREVIDGFLAIARHLERMRHSIFLHRVLKEKNAVRLVLHEQQGWRVHGAAAAVVAGG